MTQSDFNTKYGRIAMPMPFAGATGAALASIAQTSGSVINFPDGFPQNYSAPHSKGGKYITRGEMNAIGNLATRNDFYEMCGGLNTFDENFCEKIRGYPKNAILDYLELDSYKLFKVISLIDSNFYNVQTNGVDGVNWQYLNVANADPSGNELHLFNFPDQESGYNGWSNDNLYITNQTLIAVIKPAFSGVLVYDGFLSATNTTTREVSSPFNNKAYGFAIVSFSGSTLESIASKNPNKDNGQCIYYGGDASGLLSNVDNHTYYNTSMLTMVPNMYYSFWMCSANTTIHNSEMRGILRKV